MLVLASACQGEPAGSSLDSAEPEVEQEEAGPPELRLSVSALDLGELPLGTAMEELPEAAVVLVENVGGSDLLITSLGVEGPGTALVDVELEGGPRVAPGETTTIRVSLEPDDPGEVGATLLVEVKEGGDGAVSLTGRVLGPRLAVAPEALSFPPVARDCASAAELSLSNSGNADLALSGFSLEAAGGELAWATAPEAGTLEPGETLDLVLAWTPGAAGTATGTLLLSSDDPQQPERSVALSVEGLGLDEVEDRATVAYPMSSDILLHMDRTSYDLTFDFLSSSTFLTESLRDGGVDQQVAVVVEDSGCVRGSDLFVDNTFSESDAHAAIEQMVGYGASYGSTSERGFTALSAAIAEAEAGGCNQGLIRDEAPLALVLVSDEPEQSTEDWSTYVAAFRATKDDPDLVAVHAIGALPPSSCTVAQAFTGAYEATVETGGSFGDLCTSNLDTLLVGLGEAIAARARSVPLSQAPVEETLAVWVDGVELSEGWSYDAASNSVSVEAWALPASDAEVVLRYEVGSTCG